MNSFNKIIALTFLLTGSAFAQVSSITKTTVDNNLTPGTGSAPGGFNVTSSTPVNINSGGVFTAKSGSIFDFHSATLPNLVGSNWGLPQIGVNAHAGNLSGSTGNYPGQFGMSIDGVPGIWNGSNWTTVPFDFSLAGNTYMSNITQNNGNFTGNNLGTTTIVSYGSNYQDNCLFLGNLSTFSGALGTNGYAAVVFKDRYSGNNGYIALTVNGDQTLPLSSGYEHSIGLATSYPAAGVNNSHADNEIDEWFGDDIGSADGATPGGHHMLELLFNDPSTVHSTATVTNGSTVMNVTGSTTGIQSTDRAYGPGLSTSGVAITISGSVVTLASASNLTNTAAHGGLGDYYSFCPASPAPPRKIVMRPWNLSNLRMNPVFEMGTNGQIGISSGSLSDPTFVSGRSLSVDSFGLITTNALNNTQVMSAQNPTTGTTAQMNFKVLNDGGSGNGIRLGMTSTGFTPTNGYVANQGYLESQQASLFTIKTDNSIPINFSINANEAARFSTNGNLLIGTTTDINNCEINAVRSVNQTATSYFQNSNSGTVAQSNVKVQNDGGSGNGCRVGITSTGFTTFGAFHANQGFVEAQQAADLTLKTDNGNPIIFDLQDTEVGRFVVTSGDFNASQNIRSGGIIYGTGGTPTHVDGTNSTATVTGTNIDGTLQVVVTGGISSGVITTMTLANSKTFPTKATMTLTSSNAATATLAVTTLPYVTGTSTTIVLNTGAIGLPIGTYLWNYHIGGY